MRSLIFATALPPPIHGQSTISLKILERLKFLSFDKFYCVDLSPNSLKKSYAYHFRRIAMVFFALCRVFFCGVISREVVLYTVYEAGWGVIYNYMICGLARVFGSRIFLHHHTSRHLKLFDRRFKALDLILGGSVTHIVLSDRMKDDLVAMYKPSGDVFVLPNLALLDELNFSGDLTRASHSPGLTFGLLSNLTVEKGVINALNICRDLLGKGISAKLILAGGVFDVAVQSEIDNFHSQFPDSLVCMGAISGYEQKRVFFESIDYFLFPTIYRYEAQPLVLLEALSFGKICFSNDVGYIRDVLGEVGIYIDMSNPSESIFKWVSLFEIDQPSYARSVADCGARFDFLKRHAADSLAGLFSKIQG